MNFRLTFAMIFVLAVIVGFYAWFQHHPVATVPESHDNLLIDPAPTNISSITYTRDGTVQAAFTRNTKDLTGNWTMTTPVNAPADALSMNEIVSTLTSLKFKEKFEPEAVGDKSAEDTGVKSPKDVIQFQDDKGRSYKLNIGKRSVGGAYATLDTNPTIYLLQTNPLDNFSDTDKFRSKTVVDVPTDRVSELTFTTGKTKIDLLKTDGKWVIDQPIPTRANQSVVEDVLGVFRNLQAEGFSEIDKDMLATGLTPPVISVTADFEEPAPATAPAVITTHPKIPPVAQKKSVTLQLGYYTDPTNKKSVYASQPDSKNVFLLSAEIFNRLHKQLNDLRDPAITPLPVGDATTIDILEPASTNPASPPKIQLALSNGTWQLQSADLQLSADTDAVTNFLGALRDLRANKYVDGAGDLKSIGLDPPLKTIQLQIPGHAQREVLFIGKPEIAEPLTPVQRQGEPTVYLVQSPDLALLNSNLLDLRGRKIADYKPTAIQEITLSGPAIKHPVTLQRDGSHWKILADGKTLPADETKISPLLGDLDPLQAAKWTQLAPLSKSNTPSITLKLTVTDIPAAPTTSAPALAAPVGPTIPKTHDILLIQQPDKSWTASTDAASPNWTFVPTPTLIEHLTTVDYLPAPTTQPTTTPATQPSTNP